MPGSPFQVSQQTPSLETYLLGRIDFRRCLDLQKQLLPQVAQRDDGQVVVLLCEHPTVVTVGRSGSAEQIATQARMIRNGQVEVLWVNRGGGSLVHSPGQLAIYPIVPLRWHGFSVGEFVERLQVGIVETLHEMNIHAHLLPGRHGVWGRTGQLASLGVAVRDWVSYYGAYLNVCPSMGLFRMVESDRLSEDRAGSLVAERGRGARMTTVKASLVRHLADAFGCERSHLYTGHPLLRRD
ncbi:MAG TPA: lipoyl(octanoyl) transferase LipB [Thermoguttaceae bacterium]|nr:lipoyl(octanoyl) transferase LipB [Thermoguttaceae bacterium]